MSQVTTRISLMGELKMESKQIGKYKLGIIERWTISTL